MNAKPHIAFPAIGFAMLVAVVLSCTALTGCGRSGSPAGSAPPALAGDAPKGDGLPEAHCPARIAGKQQGPDIGGLTLGLSRDAALNLARCAQQDAVVANEDRFFSQMDTGALKLGPQQFTVQSGETAACNFKSLSDMQACGLGQRVWKRIAESVTVATPGVPGHETAVGIWRSQDFKPGEQPAAETVQQALTAKYGAPQIVQKDEGNGYVGLWWLQDPGSQPIGPQNPLINRCRSINARNDASQSWSEACGLTIAATIGLARDNPLLVRQLSVGMVDQARLYAYGTAMQDEILALEQQRKQGELKAAKDQAVAPKL